GERRGLRRGARDAANRAGVDAPEERRQRLEIHRLFQTIANRLVHEWMIRNLTIAWNIFEAGGGIREDGGHQIVGEHALDLRRHLSSAAAAWNGEGDRRVPSPARLKHRRIEKCLNEDVASRRRMQV